MLTASDGVTKSMFGEAVSLSNETVITGAAGAAYVYTLEPEPFQTCVSPSDCTTGFCVDGICCDTACGGDSKIDCLACSKAAGGPEDGVCSPLAYGSSCDDGDACTLVDMCVAAGVCSPGNPVVCPEGTCDSGVCTAPSDAGVEAESGSGGSPGTGGAPGIGGSAGAAGEGTGGSAGHAGEGGSAGSSGGGAFHPKDAGAGVDGASVDGGGCGCRMGQRGAAGWLLIVLAAALRRNSPRRPRRPFFLVLKDLGVLSLGKRRLGVHLR